MSAPAKATVAAAAAPAAPVYIVDVVYTYLPQQNTYDTLCAIIASDVLILIDGKRGGS